MKPAARLALVQGAPLAPRNGITPSRVFLPSGPWSSTYEFLCQRFPHITPDILLMRLERGDIVDAIGQPVTRNTPYQANAWLWYYRDVPDEVPVPFKLNVLFQDDLLLAVDKPHFLSSTPGGRYLRETALTRVRDLTGNSTITPLHRLDRDTAGVLVFCVNPQYRGAYQALFQTREVAKEYEAIAPVISDMPEWIRCRMEQRPGHFTMQVVQGEPNSVTQVQLIRSGQGRALYSLKPLTGRKHQLRVHMSLMGAPIENDVFYPQLQPLPAADDFARPLQLLARRLQFTDPVTGELRDFISQRQLAGLGDIA